MPPDQTILLTDVRSVANVLGANGVMLRMDDDSLLTGTITGASNTTPIVITCASHGLTTDDLIQITGVRGNTYANGIWFVTRIDANSFSLDTSVGSGTWTSGGTFRAATYPESDWMRAAINVGTAKVIRYIQNLYDIADLTDNWSVWMWATHIAAHYVCCRRANLIPQTVMNLFLETMEELEAVKNLEMPIENIGYRNDTQMTFTALRVDRKFSIKQLRAEASISGRTPPQFPRHWDLSSQIIGPAEFDSIR